MRTTLLVLLIALGPVAAAVPVAPTPLASPPVAPPMIDDAPPSLPKDGAVDGEWTYRRDPNYPRGGYWFRYRYVLRSVSAGGVLQDCVT